MCLLPFRLYLCGGCLAGIAGNQLCLPQRNFGGPWGIHRQYRGHMVSGPGLVIIESSFSMPSPTPGLCILLRASSG